LAGGGVTGAKWLEQARGEGGGAGVGCGGVCVGSGCAGAG
jgi:hypothetical protein